MCGHRCDQAGLVMFKTRVLKHEQRNHSLDDVQAKLISTVLGKSCHTTGVIARFQMGAALVVLCVLVHLPSVAAMRTPMRTSSAIASPSRPDVRCTHSRNKLSRISHDTDPCPIVFAQLQHALSDLSDIETSKVSRTLSLEESRLEESLRKSLRRSPAPSSWFADLSECDYEHAEVDATRVSALEGSNGCFFAAGMNNIVTSVTARTIITDAPDMGTLKLNRY